MELPTDVAEKIVGMLKVEARPYAVLMVGKYDQAKIRKGSITQEEEHDLFPEGSMYFDPKYIESYPLDTLALGYDALALGFRFFNEEGRIHWQDREPYEMYRDAVREIA